MGPYDHNFFKNLKKVLKKQQENGNADIPKSMGLVT